MTFHEGHAFRSPEAGEPPVDFGHYLDTYGLGPEEVSATISFGGYTGTVGDMLSDERCPVGNIVAGAYAAEGLAGVESKLGAIKSLYGDFELPISEETRTYHQGRVERSQLATKPISQSEKPDFLEL